MNSSKYNCKVDVYSFAMLAWELMAEKQPFHEVKRVWDLPRIVVDGLRPAIDEEWPRPMQRMIADCWMQSHERRPTMKEVTIVLGEMFEKERKVYEKSKKTKKSTDDGGSSVGSATAHTGNLEALIEQSTPDIPISPEDTPGNRAEDMPGEDDELIEKKPKKKKKKAADDEQQ